MPRPEHLLRPPGSQPLHGQKLLQRKTVEAALGTWSHNRGVIWSATGAEAAGTAGTAGTRQQPSGQPGALGAVPRVGKTARAPATQQSLHQPRERAETTEQT